MQKRISYQFQRELKQSIKDTKKDLWQVLEFIKILKTCKFQDTKYKFSLINYPKEKHQILNFSNLRYSMELLKNLSQSKSQFIDGEDMEELQRDLSFVSSYIDKRQWVSVIRWLSNLSSQYSTLDKLFSNYFENVKNKKY